MERRAQKSILQVLDGSVPTSRSYVRSFQFQERVVTNQHELTVEIAQPCQEELKISNYFARAEGDNLVKITHIQLKDRIIKIIDRLHAKDKNLTKTSQKIGLKQSQTSMQFSNKQFLRKQKLGKKKRQGIRVEEENSLQQSGSQDCEKKEKGSPNNIVIIK